ncbi:MAG: PEP-CTERM sorting domain-containing protein [Pseudomonadota bacterium]
MNAEAVPIYTAQAGALSGADSEMFSGPTPVTASAGALQTFSVSGLPARWEGEATAHAGAGFLRGSSHTLVNIENHQASLGSGTRAGGSHAVMNIDDMIISGAGTTIDTVLHLTLTGNLAASAIFHNALGGSGSYAEVAISISTPGGGGSGGARLGAAARAVGAPPPPPDNSLNLTNSGLLTGYGGGLLNLAIPLTALPLNSFFSISLGLDTTTLATYNVGGTGPNPVPIIAEAFSSFGHTFSFALDGPVFDLPVGYTVNSVAGDIENNSFVGLQAGPEPQSVPEPMTLSLLGAGLAGIGIARRRV